MQVSTLRQTAGPLAQRGAELNDIDLETLAAELVMLNGFRCGRVLAVRPARRTGVWRVSCMADSAMDALVTYRLDARTGIVSA